MILGAIELQRTLVFLGLIAYYTVTSYLNHNNYKYMDT